MERENDVIGFPAKATSCKPACRAGKVSPKGNFLQARLPDGQGFAEGNLVGI